MSQLIADAATRVFTQMYDGLDGVLGKAAAHAEATKIDEGVLMGWRLAPDMLPMSRQVQIATELPARGMARLASVEVPSFPDTETSITELRTRIVTARSYVNGIDMAQVVADPDGTVTFPTGGGEQTMPRAMYLTNFIFSNLYFHVTTTYGLLRSCGVDIGKRDFLAMG